MGAWGCGPFDNDQAMDFIGDLAHRHARLDPDYRVVDGTVDTDAVRVALTAALEAATRPEAAVEAWGRCDNAYAAAGLVAAVLTDTPASGGTRLFEALAAGPDVPLEAPLGLGAHCGYADILDRQTAEQLRVAAVTATEALSRDTEWLDGWSDPDHQRDLLTRLKTTLTT